MFRLLLQLPASRFQPNFTLSPRLSLPSLTRLCSLACSTSSTYVANPIIDLLWGQVNEQACMKEGCPQSEVDLVACLLCQNNFHQPGVPKGKGFTRGRERERDRGWTHLCLITEMGKQAGSKEEKQIDFESILPKGASKANDGRQSDVT